MCRIEQIPFLRLSTVELNQWREFRRSTMLQRLLTLTPKPIRFPRAGLSAGVIKGFQSALASLG
jgi:hypothetical protein